MHRLPRSRSGWPALIAACAILASFSTEALAQRGADFVVQEDVEQGPRSGFPATLDTTTVDRGKMVHSYPWLGIDYGVTENWSIGTNVALLLSNIGGNPTAYVRTRYRVYSDSRFVAVVDFSGIALRAKNDEEVLSGYGGLVGGNLRYRLSSRHSLTGSALAGQFSTRASEDGVVTDKVRLRGSLLAVSYELTPNRWFSLRASVVHSPQLSVFADSIGATTELSVRGTGLFLERTGVRALASFRVGRWLFTGGGGYSGSSTEFIPWLSVNRMYL